MAASYLSAALTQPYRRLTSSSAACRQLGDLVFLEIADEAPIFFNMTALMDGELLNLNNYEANVNMTWLSVTMSK